MGNIDSRIKQALDRAAESANKYHNDRVAKQEQRMTAWKKQADKNMVESGLVRQLGPRGGIDTIIVEMAIDVGFQYHAGCNVLVWAAIGGHDITQFLPPNIIDEINYHIQYEGHQP